MGLLQQSEWITIDFYPSSFEWATANRAGLIYLLWSFFVLFLKNAVLIAKEILVAKGSHPEAIEIIEAI